MLHSIRDAGSRSLPLAAGAGVGERNRSLPTQFRRVPRLSVLAVVLISLAACGGDDAATSTVSPVAVGPAEILQRTSARLAETRTTHFKLTVDGVTYVDEAKSIELLGAEGDLERPDRVRTTFKAKVSRGVNVTIELITIGDQSWSTDLITGKWGPAPAEFGYSPSVLFDNQNGIGPVMNKIVDPVQREDGDLDGRGVYRISGQGPGAIIGPLTMSTMTGDPVAVDLWIDRETYDLLRIMLTEPASAEKAGATWILDLSRHDQKVAIEPPV